MYASLVLLAGLTLAATPYSATRRQADQDGRPWVVLVGAEWCPACQKLHRVLDRMEQRGALSGIHVSHVDFDRQRRLAEQLMNDQDLIPQLMVLRKIEGRWYRSEVLVGERSEAAVRELIETTEP